METDAGRTEHANKAKKFLPEVIETQVQNLLKIASIEDIPRVISILGRMKADGLSAIWSDIKADVIVSVRSKLGSIFPQELVEEAKNMPLDMKGLGVFIVGQMMEVALMLRKKNVGSFCDSAE